MSGDFISRNFGLFMICCNSSSGSPRKSDNAALQICFHRTTPEGDQKTRKLSCEWAILQQKKSHWYRCVKTRHPLQFFPGPDDLESHESESIPASARGNTDRHSWNTFPFGSKYLQGVSQRDS
jgi:hypothetical protein